MILNKTLTIQIKHNCLSFEEEKAYLISSQSLLSEVHGFPTKLAHIVTTPEPAAPVLNEWGSLGLG